MVDRTPKRELPIAVRRVLARLCQAASPDEVVWALTGSTGFALQDVPVTPQDIDVQTDERGAYAIERRLADHVADPVSFSEGPGIRSHFGRLVVEGITVELMGALQKRRSDGHWEPPVDVARHRTFVPMDGVRVPVLDLGYEERAYRRLGRIERADLLRSVLEQRQGKSG
jgi:hypothetical protein